MDKAVNQEQQFVKNHFVCEELRAFMYIHINDKQEVKL